MLGCVCVVFSYALTLPFRSWVQYDAIVNGWTRYQLFPQLGVVLILCGVLKQLGPEWLSSSNLSLRNVLLVAGVVTLKFLLHQEYL